MWLCWYAYILVKETITITAEGDDDTAERIDERNKDVIFKNCAPFTKCISRINNIDIDNAQDFDIVMPMYNFIEYSDNYWKRSGSLWQYYKNDPNDNMTQSESFKSKIKITKKNSCWWECKRCWNNCAIKIFKQILENPWNAVE